MYRLDKSIFRNSEKKLKLELYKVTLSNKIQNSPLKMQEEKKSRESFFNFERFIQNFIGKRNQAYISKCLKRVALF
jgi:hypothetical protein